MNTFELRDEVTRLLSERGVGHTTEVVGSVVLVYTDPRVYVATERSDGVHLVPIKEKRAQAAKRALTA